MNCLRVLRGNELIVESVGGQSTMKWNMFCFQHFFLTRLCSLSPSLGHNESTCDPRSHVSHGALASNKKGVCVCVYVDCIAAQRRE